MRTEQRWLRIIYTIFPRISCKRIPILWGKGTQKSILKSKEQVMSTCLAPNSLSSLWNTMVQPSAGIPKQISGSAIIVCSILSHPWIPWDNLESFFFWGPHHLQELWYTKYKSSKLPRICTVLWFFMCFTFISDTII